MKKAIKQTCFLLLVLIFLLNTVPAFADTPATNYDGEILFRKIPWGSNYYEVMEALADLDLEWKEGEMLGNYDSVESFRVILWEEGKSTNVAGIDVSIELQFAYTLTDDGSLPRDKEHTALYLAKYVNIYDETVSNPTVYNLQYEAIQRVYTALVSIYGDSTNEYEKYNQNHINRFHYDWTGLNQSKLSVYSDQGSRSRDAGKYDLRVVYQWEGGDALVREADAYMKEWTRAQVETDGL